MRSPRQDGHWSAAAVTDAFPPTSAAEVLALCDGVWMSLRSTLQPADSDEGWHSSEKGELTLHWTAASDHCALGTLDATPPSGITSRLTFLADGRLETGDGKQGRWELQANGRHVNVFPVTEPRRAPGWPGRTMYPLRPGYASTLMKLQGATLEHLTLSGVLPPTAGELVDRRTRPA